MMSTHLKYLGIAIYVCFGRNLGLSLIYLLGPSCLMCKNLHLLFLLHLSRVSRFHVSDK